MQRFRVPYPPEFRRQMVELVRTGRTPADLSREFEPTAQSIWNWVRQAERDAGARKDGGAASPEREEQAKLRRENHRLRKERDILAKAAAWSRGRGPRTGLPVHERAPGGISDRHDGPRAGCLGVRLLCLEAPPRLGPCRTAVAHKRVARLMRQAGLRGVSRRRNPRTTQREPSHRPANDLVGRDFRAVGPNRLWVADITYVPTAAGFLFLAIALDAWSRRIVGWAMATDLRTRLVLDALDMAVTTRKPTDVVHTRTRAANTPRWHLASDAGKQASVPPLARSATHMTTPWPRRSSPPSSANCWTGAASVPRPRPGWSCSRSSYFTLRHSRSTNTLSRQTCQRRATSATTAPGFNVSDTIRALASSDHRP
ncbi:MAG: family transposase [Rubritepida sp.]|nr:family transposase [Rubritepida sp.]